MAAEAQVSVHPGKDFRAHSPRRQHAVWQKWSGRPDPIATLRESDEGRLTDLLPIRYSRMLQNPFTFYRGAAAIMACDLAQTPVSGIQTQICGDCHLLNFGGFGTPENRFVFDVNDFDETTVGAWEWDVKRLVTSVVIAGQHLSLPRSDIRAAALLCAQTYREQMRRHAGMTVLEVWYARVDEGKLADVIRSAKARRQYLESVKKAKSDSREHSFPRFASDIEGSARIEDEPPLLYHPPNTAAFLEMVGKAFSAYRATLPEDRKSLFDRFRLRDAAYKVVGVGSVGTRCLVGLFIASGDDSLVLQMKEARASVYETYAGAPHYKSEGKRVVIGQQALQAASDLFLGYTTADDGHDYYVRQLRDMKTSTDVDHMTASDLEDYSAICGWTLARAHAKASGSAATIAGYLGRSNLFDEAIADFAHAYAAQNEEDYEQLVVAGRAGKLPTAS